MNRVNEDPNTPWGQGNIDTFIDGYITELLISGSYTMAEGEYIRRVARATPNEIHPDDWSTIYRECGEFLQNVGTTIRACIDGDNWYDAGVAFLRTRNMAKELSFNDCCPKDAEFLADQSFRFGPVIALKMGGWIRVQAR